MASFRDFPFLRAACSVSTSFLSVAARSAWTNSSPAAGASRDSPKCGRKTAREYFHCLMRAFSRSIEFAVCASIG